ncbi:MAG: histidinol-phosphatase HisJ [Clostridia bacterium]|jgi:histidinol-phosphatase (PHP family)|nr:histidinol-phosphatase HisJ [Clostridia bacterium]
MMIKRDGHTHTHFCLHASGEEAESYVLRALELKFTTYSFTEHLPLPEKFLQDLPYEPEWKDALRIAGDDFGAYIREMERLQKKYRDRIRLFIGSEIDYLPDELAYTRSMLKEYGPFMQDGLLSVHLLPVAQGYRAVDHDPADFEDGLMKYYGGYEEAQLAYYAMVKEALQADLGPYKPKRIGHLTLCNKFQCRFNPERAVFPRVRAAVVDILEYMKEHGYSLDVNAAGLYKEYCGEIYPSPWIITLALQQGIPLVYGSDAHAVSDVGRSYEVYERLVSSRRIK